MINIFTSKLSKIVATLGTTLCLFIGTILFYEGVPFLNWWPINKIPVISYLVTGEINRRSKNIVNLAVLEERELWRESKLKALKQRNDIIEQKNIMIRQIGLENLQIQNKIRNEQQETIDSLNKSIEELNKDDSNVSKNTNINPLKLRIPSRVYENIN